MILTTLVQPPEAPPEAPEDRQRKRPANVRARERWRRYQRALAIGLIASVLIHVLIILVSPLVIRFAGPGGISLPAPPAGGRASPQGTRVIELKVAKEEPTPARPEQRPQPRPQARPERPGPTPETTGAEAGRPTPSAAERLRPHIGDWRLWVTPPLTRRDLTPAEQQAELRQRLYSEIGAINDSMALARERAANAMDWTIGKEGSKWGITPGQLHLGPITLPLPFYLGPTREQLQEQDEWNAIQRQAGQGAIDDQFKDRVKAIRERKEQERKKAQQDSTGNL